MDSFDTEIAQIFLEEAQQLLIEAEGAFLALDAGDRSVSQIDKIFRLAHNFKGSAKAAGFEGLSRFAHKVEDVLVKIRNGALAPNKSVCTALLKALDVLKVFVAGLKGDFSFTQDTSALEHELLSLRNDSEPVQQDPLQAMAGITEHSLKQGVKGQAPPAPEQKPVQASSTTDEFLRVSTRKLDEVLNLVGEMVVNQTVMNGIRAAGGIQSESALEILSSMAKIVSELQDSAMSLRMMPIQPLFQRMRRSLRDVAELQGKEIELAIEGEHVELDKTILDRITDPLNHLIRNAADHGIESKERRISAGKPLKAIVTLKAEQQEDRILLTISDDGGGMNREVLVRKAVEKGIIRADAELSDAEAYALIFKPGFSTKEQVTDISGRGVGMDVVLRTVEDLKGKIEIQTELGKGSSFIITLPLSLSIIAGLVVSIDQRKYVVPISQLVETIEYQKSRIETSTGKGRMINLRGEVLPIYSLSELLHGCKVDGKTSARKGLVILFRGKKVSFEIDEVVGQQQVVLKKLGPKMSGLRGVVAGAILSDGEPGLILNLQEFAKERTMDHAA